MYQVINYIFDDDISLVPPFEISFQSFFERALKTGDAIQELNSLIFNFLLALTNYLPTLEYLWKILLRFAIIAPYVIYSQYKQYKLERRIYELTWTLCYQLRRDMFKIVTPQSKTSVRTSNSCINEKTAISSPVRTTSESRAAPGTPRRRSKLHVREAAGEKIGEIRSYPDLLDLKKGNIRWPIVNLLELSHQTYSDTHLTDSLASNRKYEDDQANLWQCTNEENEATEQVSYIPVKKFKRDNAPVGSSNPIVGKVFQKPQVACLQRTFTVEYFNVCFPAKTKRVPSMKEVRQSHSKIYQDMSTTSQTKQFNMESKASKMSSTRNNSQSERYESRWTRIMVRNNNVRNERLAKLKEIEMQKQQELENKKKMEAMKRRAIIARIRKQNKKIIMEQKGMKMGENEGHNGIVVPVVRVEANDSTSQPKTLQEREKAEIAAEVSGQKPILRVLQRTVTIEHTTAKISNVNNENDFDIMGTKTLHMTDLHTKSGDELTYREPIKENTGQLVSRNTEYYLLSRGAQPNKQLVYVKMCPETTNVANKMETDPEVDTCRELEPGASNLLNISKDSHNVFDYTENLSRGCLDYNTRLDNSESIGLFKASLSNSVASQPLICVDPPQTKDEYKCVSDIEATMGDEGESTARFEDGFDRRLTKSVIISNTYDVEAPPSPNAQFELSEKRPVIKRARRRLAKSPNNPSEQKILPLELLKIHADAKSAKFKDLTQQSEPKLPDAKLTSPKSLLLKKIEVRKRLEERRRAITCISPTINDLTSAEGNVISLESSKNLIKVPENKPRRFSLDAKAKLCQSRKAPSVGFVSKIVNRKVNQAANTMKKANLKCAMYQSEQRDDKDNKKQNPSSPKGAVNIATSNRRKPSAPAANPGVVHRKTGGTHCRNKTDNNKCGTAKPDTLANPIGELSNKQETPNSGKRDKCRDPGGCSTGPRDENFPSILVLAGEKEDKFSPEELGNESHKDDFQSVETTTESGTADSSKSKRSDFLTFQMDEAGHPIPVTHSKDRTVRISDRKPRDLKPKHHSMTEEQGKRRSSPIQMRLAQSKRCSKNSEKVRIQNTINDKEWDKRMKMWEKKRIRLSTGQNKAGTFSHEMGSKINVNPNPEGNENSLDDARMKRDMQISKSADKQVRFPDSEKSFNDSKIGRENDVITNKERHDRVEEPKVSVNEENNQETQYGCFLNECVQKKEFSEKEEMVRVLSSPNTTPDVPQIEQIRSLESQIVPSSEVQDNKKIDDSQEKSKNKKFCSERVSKSRESLRKPTFVKSILSPIQSKSDNNYNIDGAVSESELRRINIKQLNGDFTSLQSHLDKTVEKGELKGESATKGELQQSSAYSSSNKLQLEKETENRKNNESISLELRTQGIDYPLDSEKENVTKKERPKGQRKERKNTELIPLESEGRNIQDTYRIEYPQDCEEENEGELKSASGRRTSELVVDSKTVNVTEGKCNENSKGGESKVEGVAVKKGVCMKTKEISDILDKLLIVTKTLNKKHGSKEFKKHSSKPVVFNSSNDRPTMNAIVCYPEDSSIDDVGLIPGKPLFLDSVVSQKKTTPIVVECVTTTPSEFFKKSRETNDRFLKNINDEPKEVTRIEWYEDLRNLTISSVELDTHQDVDASCKETAVDRRGCKSVSSQGNGRVNRKVKRYEIHHDASHCYINNTRRRGNELSPYY